MDEKTKTRKSDEIFVLFEQKRCKGSLKSDFGLLQNAHNHSTFEIDQCDFRAIGFETFDVLQRRAHFDLPINIFLPPNNVPFVTFFKNISFRNA